MLGITGNRLIKHSPFLKEPQFSEWKKLENFIIGVQRREQVILQWVPINMDLDSDICVGSWRMIEFTNREEEEMCISAQGMARWKKKDKMHIILLRNSIARYS